MPRCCSTSILPAETFSDNNKTRLELSAALCPRKNDTDVGRYNIDVHQLIFVICGENVVKRVHHQMAVLFPTSSNNVSALRGKT